MVFQPLVPVGGITGFRFIERTLETQLETFSKRPDIQRMIDYFNANAAGADTAEKLVNDRQLLTVALGAFGLADQVDKKAFIRKILEDGTIAEDALAKRLSNPVWEEFSRSLGYGDVGGLLGVQSTRAELVERFRIRQFEEAVGAQDADLETALLYKRELGSVVSESLSDRAGWLKLMGRADLRGVVEAAFNLPQSFGTIDLDQQVKDLMRLSRREFGSESPTALLEPANLDKAIRRYLVIQQARQGFGAPSGAETALTLLRQSDFGAGAQANLFASRFL